MEAMELDRISSPSKGALFLFLSRNISSNKYLIARFYILRDFLLFFSCGRIGKEEEEDKAKMEEGKAIVVLLVGVPGSGKSTFCDYIIRGSKRPWVRVCQVY